MCPYLPKGFTASFGVRNQIFEMVVKLYYFAAFCIAESPCQNVSLGIFNSFLAPTSNSACVLLALVGNPKTGFLVAQPNNNYAI